MRHRGAPVTVAVLVAALAAGCSASADAESAEVNGALASYLLEYQEQRLGLDREHAIEASEAVAVCMKEQGFDYTPNPEGEWVSVRVTSPAGMGAPEWIAEHGYGIVDGSSIGSVSGADDVADPNAATYAALSDGERLAWDTALRGDPPDFADGCLAVVDPFEPLNDLEYQNWSAAATAIDEQAADDASVVDARTTWVDCMAAAGYPGFTAPSDARESAQAAADDASPDSGGLTEQRRARLLADEIALATADDGCDGSSGYSEAVVATTQRLQAEFVDAHRDELDAWRASWVRATP